MPTPSEPLNEILTGPLAAELAPLVAAGNCQTCPKRESLLTITVS